MNRLFAVLTGLAIFLVHPMAISQEGATLVFRSEVPGDCLVLPSDAAPAYPETSPGAGGVVRVRMTFAGVDDAPLVEVFTNTAGESFEAAVRSFVKQYRLKCPAGKSRRLSQEFQFVANAGRRVLSGALHVDRATRDATTCAPRRVPPPSYPSSTFTGTTHPSAGNVLLRLVFKGPDAPEISVVHDGGWRKFADTAKENAAQYRVICEDATAYPIFAMVPYQFRMEGEAVTEFKAATLKEFLMAVDNVESRHVYFDFASMTCPFELRIYLLQPEFENVVSNPSGHFDDRREFLDWVKSLKMTLPPDMARDLKGSSMKVSVPCVILNLL